MIVTQRHITYNFHYCDFDIDPLKDNKCTSKTRLLPWVKKWNMNILTVYETSENPIRIAKSSVCPLK
jgi:hypothetical protein